MKYVVTQILRPKAEQKFPSLKEKGFVIDHCAGIAHSSVFVVRGGVRGSNDLVFIGEAPNIAAKLSDIRNSPRSSYITKAVYARLSKESKYSGGKDMWSPASRVFDGVTYQLFASSYYWKP
jgi:class 3 adenylate cyclase